MTWDNIAIIAISFILTAVAVILGYWMGRNSIHQPLSSQPKKFNPGPVSYDEDLYAEALIPPNPIGKRIATIEGENK